MNKWKVSFFFVLFLLLSSNVFWLYGAIDAGVTYTYQQVSLDEKVNAVNVLGDMIVKHGQKYSKKDILHILRQYKQDAFIVDDDGYIDFEGIKFHFESDRLIKIEG